MSKENWQGECHPHSKKLVKFLLEKDIEPIEFKEVLEAKNNTSMYYKIRKGSWGIEDENKILKHYSKKYKYKVGNLYEKLFYYE